MRVARRTPWMPASWPTCCARISSRRFGSRMPRRGRGGRCCAGGPGSSHELAAYAGLVPSTRSSGGKTAHGSVGPAGSAWLKWLFVEAVQTLKRQPGPVRSQYERLLRAKGKPKATVAAARKLCCYVYWMMKEGRSYDDWLRQRQQREVRPIQAVASVA